MKLHLGENIRENRKRMNLTQEQLADRLGVSFQSVSRWENGTTYPDMEKLPEIARLFDTTTDALLGFAEKEEKMSVDELNNMYLEAVGREDWEECADIIRRLRYEYLEELDKGELGIWTNVRVDDNYRQECIREELRLLAEMYLEKGANGMVRNSVIRLMAEIEDEDKLESFIEKYADVGLRCDKYKLLENRYEVLGDNEKHMRYSLYNKYNDLYRFIFPLFVHRNEGDAAKWLACKERNIALLNSLSGIIPEEKHPITGDGVIDIFSLFRLDFGHGYVTQLCGCGRYDEALTAMEDLADCYEKIAAMPNGERIINRCPIFESIEMVKYSWYNEESGMIGCFSFDAERKPGEFSRLDIFHYHSYITSRGLFWFTGAKFANVRYDSKWLDPLRDHPRYIEAVRRMNEACASNHRPDDNGWIWSPGLDAYNKGRKAVGKEERRPSH